MLITQSEQKAYHYKTNKALEEIVSSYNHGNYRSSVIILYTTVIYDLFLKLKELRDVYDDKIASSILNDIETENSKNYNSDWEWSLVNKIFKCSELIDKSMLAQIEYLKKIRNLSAHPVFNEDFELFEPDKYTVISLIRNMSENLFSKPPLFMSNIIGVIANDLDGKWQLYEHNLDKLKNYLNYQYFNKMSLPMKQKVLKAFWKFCFHHTDKEQWLDNLVINRKLINILIADKLELYEDFVLQESTFNEFSNISSNRSFLNLIIFFSEQPDFFKLMSENSKHIIKESMQEIIEYKPLTWFLYSSKKEHMESLDNEVNINENFDLSVMRGMRNKYSNDGYLDLYHDYIIELYKNSWNFNTADLLFDTLIDDELKLMELSKIKNILESSNENNQIFGRGKFMQSIHKIVKVGISKGLQYEDLEEFHIYNKLVSDLFAVDTSAEKTISESQGLSF